MIPESVETLAQHDLTPFLRTAAFMFPRVDIDGEIDGFELPPAGSEEEDGLEERGPEVDDNEDPGAKEYPNPPTDST